MSVSKNPEALGFVSGEPSLGMMQHVMSQTGSIEETDKMSI